ncbi:MAG: adenylyl-sulfate reductase subunit alpha [Candidatus Brocadiales bacterium]|nr:adenylyl-sulfate reductase subunit alpha [Candidatus Bathyanammoxibius amoris]
MVTTEVVNIETDILIIGGGAAGCFAAVEARTLEPAVRCLIMEKAHIDRSGCLAMGLNSINAYLHPGQSPESYVDYVKKEFMDVVREDLVLSIAEGLNDVVRKVEEWGLPIEKDDEGRYIPRGRRGVRVQGERLKPILAEAVRRSGAEVLNRVAATNLIVSGGKVVGAFGLGVRDGRLYVVKAKGVIVAAGGASGIYRSVNDGCGRHLIWYCPWNVGTGYAVGIRAGAEMTSFENRFIALRVKDVQAPTGTLALGAGARQINARGEAYLDKYDEGHPVRKSSTYFRLFATMRENAAGRGPCYLDLGHLGKGSKEEGRFKVDLLNMSPSMALLWAGRDGGDGRFEISGSEPYVVGGHGEAGYWIDVNRRTTLAGLYAAGDVAGGAPKKYASGSWVEGRIAVKTALEEIRLVETPEVDAGSVEREKERVTAPMKRDGGVSPQEMEERLQKLMDEYAGGLSTRYELSEERLLIARDLLSRLRGQSDLLKAGDCSELISAMEVVDRIDVARMVVEHLLYRKETRWPYSQSRLDYPERDDGHWLRFVNSVMDADTGDIRMVERGLNGNDRL